MQRHMVRIVSVWKGVPAVFGGCAFVVSCLLIMGTTHDSRLGILAYPLLLALIFAIVAIHEFGHLLGAICAGETVLGLSIGSIMIERRRCGLRWVWQSRNPHAAGYLVSIPDFGRDVRSQMLITVAAGPTTNIVLGLGVAFAFGVVQAPHMDAATAWLVIFAMYNIVIGLVNAIPAGALGHNDGSMFLDWWRRNARAQRAEGILRLYAHSLQGGTPSELPIDALSASTTADDPATKLWWAFQRVASAQERCDLPDMSEVIAHCRTLLRQLDAGCYESMRPAWAYFLVEEAFAGALAGNAVVESLDPVLLKRLPRHLRLRYESAVCLDARDLAGARKLLVKSLREVEGIFAPGSRRYEKILLERLRVELDRATVVNERLPISS